jgi:hypothetical protein
MNSFRFLVPSSGCRVAVVLRHPQDSTLRTWYFYL